MCWKTYVEVMYVYKFNLKRNSANKIASNITKFMFDNIFGKLSRQILFATRNNP